MKYQLGNIGDGYHKGWLRVKLVNQSNIEIPQGIIVEQISLTNKENLFKITEGIFKELIVYIPKEYLTKYIWTSKETKIILDLSSKNIHINNQVFDVLLSDNFKTIKTMLISIPDYLHTNIPAFYTNEKLGGSKFAETWFNLVFQDSFGKRTNKYFHFGSYSQGCITFPYKKQKNASDWNNIYNFLIKNRIKSGICSLIKVI